ncbi:16S rRNA (adenine(1518)-N(6)/adenine(1519)-N(6))-dimethyltransferase RsmA [Acanthopleuribacter pedis]|uniref:Ribosomal RNA small subunit methyltransferase A n=1 Tax=Acanthopleuribacter pedis TaxID=442870 RepID=A0A8J7QJR2_9BACT|nr:16S rRNA (adenine(1518)-N(6)/adenine(1519)-N(6))-dimethyltransferase RsmA [Acanthopleuribacter pedis]MBO1322166.1 ribosomal RNA small subunit methyltransferase A [Acanthopleuribacter pedis]
MSRPSSRGAAARPHAKKRFGQHFLTDANLIRKILDLLEADAADAFVEIGPGPATLTMPFSQRGFPLTVVETDADMVTYLQEQDFPHPVAIRHEDFLQTDVGALLQDRSTKVFSNLPYNVSVPITARLLFHYQQIPLMVFMYQKEVAERIRAKSGTRDYGPISVTTQLLYACDAHFNVPPGAFRPPPKVQSQVIRLRRLAEPRLGVADLEGLTLLLRFLFERRRKMVSGLLRKSGDLADRIGRLLPRGKTDGPSVRPDTSDAPLNGAASLLESYLSLGFDPKLRPENLTPMDYAVWFRHIKESYEP